LVAGAIWLQHSRLSAPPANHSAQEIPLVVATRALEAELPDREQVQKWLSEAKTPLESEMGLVVVDAKTALGSLVASLRAPAGQ
jgi:hypothetical protein